MDIPKRDSSAVFRDPSGRFLPGRSGNPAGKKPGTRNRATAMRELLADGDEMALARAVIDKAKAGDAVSARFVLGLVCPRPRPRGRAIALDLPEGARAGDTVAAFNAALQAMAAGEITPDEAVTVTRMLDGRREALNAFKLERELTRFHGDFIDGDELFRPAAERFREPDEDVVAPATKTEPSPLGRGQGEGGCRAPVVADERAVSSPHPDPLPEGEGIAASESATEPSPLGRGQGEGGCRTSRVADEAVVHDPHPNPLPEGEGITGPAAEIEPSPLGRGQGEGGCRASVVADERAVRSPHPNPPELSSKGPEGEGIEGMEAGEGIAAGEAETIPLAPKSPDEDLHSACIEQDLQARAAARRAAERKLAQWSYLIATEPGFDAESFIEAEIQRSAALNRSSAALPGQSSRSPSALKGVSTVLR